MADIYKFLVFIGLLTHVSPWVLESTHASVVQNLTYDVTLRCFHKISQTQEAKGKMEIDQITRIRLLKHGNTGRDHYHWTTFAEVSVPDTSRVNLTQPNGSADVLASGYVGRAEESYLSVTWPTASEDTVGHYRCEADGFAASDRSDFHFNTITLNITNHVPSAIDLVDVILRLKRKSDKLSEDMEIMAETHKLAIAVLQQEIDASQDNQTRDILNQVMVKIEENVFESRHWPTGNYSLLATADGCPHSPFRDFHNGSIKIKHTSSIAPKHAVSTPRHFKGLFYERCHNANAITFNYCNMKSPSNEEYLPWPKGSYCIRPPASRKCPPNFSLGDINFYLTSTSILEYIVEDPPYYSVPDSNKRLTDFSFCCRKDGHPDEIIFLPTGKPFYLYRYGGRCQKVRNMDVRVEWIDIDTNDSETDIYQFALVHPDSTLNDVRIYLCYYSKQSR